MRRSNFDEIFAFMSVVEAGSFVGGARMMGLSRSAAGKAMTRLESRLSVRLLNRTTRSFSLTDEGRSFHEQCKLIISNIEEAEATIKSATSFPTGSLRLTVPAAFGRRFVLPLISEYLKRWPDVTVEVNFTDRAVDIIEEGLDLAIRIGTSVSDAKSDTRLITRVVAEYGTTLCASPGYLRRMGEPALPEDLTTHDCLIFASTVHRQVWRLCETGSAWVKARGRCRLRMDSLESILDAAQADMGIALLPGFLTDQPIKGGGLKRILTDFQTELAPIMAIYPSKQHLSAKVRHFLDMMVSQWGKTRMQGLQ